MKLIGLDIGDQWTGIALSDELGILASPFSTIRARDITTTLKELLATQPVSHVVVGYPITLRGTHSAQTKKVTKTKEMLEKQFPSVKWVLWDERLTSKQAARLKQTKTKEQKLKQHALAAALILQSYLDHVALQKASP